MTTIPEQKALDAPHKITLDARSRLSVTGVLEIESFDDGMIALATTRWAARHPRPGSAPARADVRRGRGSRGRDGRFHRLRRGRANRRLLRAPVRLMELPVARQAVEFAWAAALGLALGCWYDVLRALRRRHPRLTDSGGRAVLPDGAARAAGVRALCRARDDAAVRTAWYGTRGNALVSDAQPVGAAPVWHDLGGFWEEFCA